MADRKTLKQVLEAHRKAIMDLEGVIGVGVGLSRSQAGEHCILVYTTTRERPAGLPQELEGYRIEIVHKEKGFSAF